MPTCGIPNSPSRPDMSFAYEDETDNACVLTGLNRLAVQNPVKALIALMAINLAIVAGLSVAGGQIAKHMHIAPYSQGDDQEE